MRTAAVTFAFALMSALSENAAAQNGEHLLGTWERFAQVDRLGKRLQSERTAVLIFSPDGYYSSTAVSRDKPTTTRPVSQLTIKEMLERFDGAEARYGKFNILGDTLFRTVIGSLDPANTVTQQVQLFQVVADTLILQSPSPSDKTQVKFRRMR